MELINKDKTLSYKGYLGTVERSFEDNVFCGQVIDINSLISYEGKTLDELEKDFQDAIDDYLEMCKAHGGAPEKPCSGEL